MPGKKKSSSKKGESLFTIDRFNQLKTALMPLVGPGLLFAAIFCALALLTYDVADAPSEFVAPANEGENIQNAMGSLGALLAARLFGTFGTGVWLAVIGAIMLLIQSIRGQETDQLWVRTGGVVLSTLALAALWAEFAPGFGVVPDGNGGAVGAWIVGELGLRFGWLGTPIICSTGLAIGLWCAADRMLSPILARLPFGKLVQYCRESITVVINLVQPEPVTAGGARAGGRKSKKAKSAASVAVMEPEDAEEEEWEEEDEYELTDADEEDWEEEEEEEEDWEEEEEEPEEEENSLEAAKSAVVLKIKEQLKKNKEPRQVVRAPVNSGEWKFPNHDLLTDAEEINAADRSIEMGEQAEQLIEAFNEFGINAEIERIDPGPTVTLFAVRLERGTKIKTLTSSQKDLERAINAPSLRIDSNIGDGLVGIEVPNTNREIIRFKEILEGTNADKMQLPMFLGKSASGDPIVEDLTKMPHMLIAGTTGSGKSVCVNTVLMSWLYTKNPNEVKLVLVDPKQVEFDPYRGIPHLAMPVVVQTSGAKKALDNAVKMMESRYTLIREAKQKSIVGYNKLAENPDDLYQKMNVTKESDKARIPTKLPYIVIVVDELADLVLKEGKDVINPIISIAQKARAVGIHLILATQRPSAQVVTGLIKANVSFRVACQVNTGLDSRIMLDRKGAEDLLGNGDMLIDHPKKGAKLFRAQGALVEEHEIEATVDYLKEISGPQYERELTVVRDDSLNSQDDPVKVLEKALEDPKFDEAVKMLIERNKGASITAIKTNFGMGDTKASRFVEQMRKAGIAGDAEGPGKVSTLLVDLEGWEDLKKLVESNRRSNMISAYHGEDEEDLDGEEYEEEWEDE